MSAAPVYCLCGKPYDPTKFMIQCDACKEWFHGSCVGLHEHQSNDIEKYHCPKCEKMFGPSISKRRTNWHRQDYSEADAEGKPVQTGTPVFIKELKSRHFPNADEVLLVMRGQQLTLPALTQTGFTKPILVENTDGLGIVIPPSTFSVEDVEKYLGPEFEIDAIDVTRQDDIHMTFSEFVRYFNSPVRSKIINLISLEFSNSRLSPLIEAPYIVNKLSWVQNIWPDQLPDNCTFSKPFVQKYCLVGVRDSYTDFHIDFGGSSVWYHVLRGEKVFYLIRPTMANLALYKRWMASSNRSETFFGDQVDACFKCTVKQGQTLFIPTAWIHAVFTPVDSLVFGGNFLHSLNLPLQLQVYDIEKRIKTPDKFRFPWFETINWYAAKHILEEIKDQNGGDRKPLPYLIQGAKALVSALKSWTQDKDYLKNHKDEIPSTLSYTKLIKDLTKEVRNAEKSTQNKKPKLRQLPPRDRRGKVRLRLGVNLEYPQLKDEPVLNSSTNLNSLNHIPAHVAETKPNILQDDIEVAYEQSLIKMISEHDTKNTSHNDQYATQSKPTTVRQSAVNVKPSLTPVTNTSPPVQLKLDESVYEFHDSDEDQLVVDENPRRSTVRKPTSKKILDYGRKQSPIKMKLPFAFPKVQMSELKKATIKQGHEATSSLARSVQLVTNGRNTEYKELKVDVSQAAKSDSKQDDNLASPKLGGIEELLRASGYATEGAKRISKLNMNQKLETGGAEHLDATVSVKSEERSGDGEDPFVATNSGRASPSTREAIQGMLSMGLAVQFSSNLTSSAAALSELQASARSQGNRMHATVSPLKHSSGSLTIRTGTKRKRKIRPRDDEVTDEEEFLGSCHQDDEFIYPSLEASDEDGPVFKNRGRHNADESWNPKARLLPNCPKPDRPVREGVRKEAVESGLAAAAAKLAHLPPPKRPYHKKKLNKIKTLAPINSIKDPQPGPSSNDNIFDSVASLTSKSGGSLKGKKPKKGFATAKQRLGRILKIHKMLH